MVCDPAFLREVHLFKLLDEEERVALAGVLDLQHFVAGDALFSFGDPGDRMFIVRSGSVEIFAQDLMGQKIVLETAGPGAQFGELALFDGGDRTANATMAEEGDLLVLDRDDLVAFLRHHPEAGLEMLGIMSRRIRETNVQLRRLSARNASDEMEQKQTRLDRLIDWVAAFSGSVPFLVLHAVFFTLWVGWNILLPPFDPYPFGLLTMAVSLEAIMLSVLVLLSQNRQAAKDHIRDDVEYDVNMKAELEVAHLHDKVDHLQSMVAGRLERVEKLLSRPQIAE
jgi:CRP/FNR family transcriptional regulator, cyclic AMP receptor protein